MRLAQGTLIKRSTNDGLFEIEDVIPIGKAYIVDLDTKRDDWFFNTVKRRHHSKTMVDVKEDENDEWASFPLELLRIDRPS